MATDPSEAHILVIEDDANNLIVITDLLRMAGITNIYSRSMGWQGLKLAQSMPRIDLILLDIQLPYEDGYAVLRQIRAISALDRVPVVAVTANVHPGEAIKMREAGFNGFISKPIDFDEFPKQV